MLSEIAEAAALRTLACVSSTGGSKLWVRKTKAGDCTVPFRAFAEESLNIDTRLSIVGLASPLQFLNFQENLAACRSLSFPYVMHLSSLSAEIMFRGYFIYLPDSSLFSHEGSFTKCL